MELRTLNACGACGRQYDVSFLRPGERVRCECGVRFEVEFRPAHSPRALRCTSCGANLQANAKSCSYCRAEISLEERGLSALCPGCFARLPARAKHCLECGLAIQPQALTALPSSSACPRCRFELRARAAGELSVIECRACAGLWLSPSVLEQLALRADERDLVARVLQPHPPTRPAPSDKVAYLKCAFCEQHMNRKNFGSASGVIIDVCKDHGVWLDHGELGKCLDFVRAGGLDKARKRELEALKREKDRIESQVDSLRRREASWPDRARPTALGELFGEIVFGGLLDP